MAEDFFQGYWGAALEVLKKYNCRVWSQAECQTTGGLFKGTILPRAAFQDDQHIVMKVNTGYNIGVDISTITSMVETDYKKANYHIPEKEFPYTEGLPHVKLLGTGGTIASRLDYRTGAVIPAFSPGELYGAVPELADICNLDTEKVFAVFSENMSPKEYIALAKKIGEAHLSNRSALGRFDLTMRRYISPSGMKLTVCCPPAVRVSRFVTPLQ